MSTWSSPQVRRRRWVWPASFGHRAVAVALAVVIGASAGCTTGEPAATATVAERIAAESTAADSTAGESTAGESTSSESTSSEPTAVERVDPEPSEAEPRPASNPRPSVPDGDLLPEVRSAVDDLLGERLLAGTFDDVSLAAIKTLGESGDPRVAWWFSDLLRIAGSDIVLFELVSASETVLGVNVDDANPWGEVTTQLMAWDIPEPPDYLTYKRNAYLVVDPRWEPFFADDVDTDWRLLSWGGVFIDDRAPGMTDEPCRCIPAADNPVTTDIAGGDEWLDDETIVFGVTINDQSRAYPRSIMEVREMVNDTLGGRDFAMPYCTLCGSAQVFFTDNLPDGIDRPVLRTSGLLSRSNKVMFDVVSTSVFNTFTGDAISGPLREAGVSLDQHSVVTTTWGAWKREHGDTDVLAVELANGRPNSDLRNTRDADGPIFPIGSVDDRLPVQEDVLGVFTARGVPVAFRVSAALDAIGQGVAVSEAGIEVIADSGGLRAVDAESGDDLGGHQAFWFAWSQFHPDTIVWQQP